jgi:hypothetical protein
VTEGGEASGPSRETTSASLAAQIAAVASTAAAMQSINAEFVRACIERIDSGSLEGPLLVVAAGHGGHGADRQQAQPAAQ